MGHSQADKAASRARILAAAARQIREHGLDAVSLGSVMRSAAMTHGGFYNHFGSREELIEAALRQALEESVQKLPSIDAAGPDPQGFQRFVRSYLSRAHRDNRESGCAVAALAADAGRTETGCREVMNDYVEGFIDKIGSALGEGRREQATLVVSAMVGALLLSRVMTDAMQSDQLLRVVRDQLGSLGGTDAGNR